MATNKVKRIGQGVYAMTVNGEPSTAPKRHQTTRVSDSVVQEYIDYVKSEGRIVTYAEIVQHFKGRAPSTTTHALNVAIAQKRIAKPKRGHYVAKK